MRFTDKSTIGELYFPDGTFQCFTLEDVIRDHKIPCQTAIPAGRYEVAITWSNRFNRPMPQLLDVPFYQGIRIHNGNFPSQTEGCLLVGKSTGVDAVLESHLAFESLFPKIKKMTEQGKLFINIVGGIPVDQWKPA